jgi:Nif11 domain
MSMINVIHLFITVDIDPEFRKKIYQCKDSKSLRSYLNSRGYYFDQDEMEDAINYLHVQCQTLEEAQNLLHKADWLRYLIFLNENNKTEHQLIT